MTYNNVRLRVLEYPKAAMCWDLIADVCDIKDKHMKVLLSMDIRTEFHEVANQIGNLRIEEMLTNGRGDRHTNNRTE